MSCIPCLKELACLQQHDQGDYFIKGQTAESVLEAAGTTHAQGSLHHFPWEPRPTTRAVQSRPVMLPV